MTITSNGIQTFLLMPGLIAHESIFLVADKSDVSGKDKIAFINWTKQLNLVWKYPTNACPT